MISTVRQAVNNDLGTSDTILKIGHILGRKLEEDFTVRTPNFAAMISTVTLAK